MTKLKERIVVGGILATLGLIGLVINAGHVAAGTPAPAAAPAAAGPTVTIAGPLPLPVSGTATVSGSVSIAGTPNVQLTNPLLVVRDAAVLSPFEGGCQGSIEEGSGVPCLINVPPGNQLVVQAVSYRAHVEPGLVPLVFRCVQNTNSFESQGHSFPSTLQGKYFDPRTGVHVKDVYVGAQSLTWAVDPSSTQLYCDVLFSQLPSTNIISDYFFTATGYLVPKP